MSSSQRHTEAHIHRDSFHFVTFWIGSGFLFVAFPASAFKHCASSRENLGKELSPAVSLL